MIVIGGGNTAMDAARTARRLGGIVTIVYRRTQGEMPVRVEELHHALEEGIALKELRAPREFVGDGRTHAVTHAILDIIELGAPDASGRRSPVATGETELMAVDLVIMALGNTPNPTSRMLSPGCKPPNGAPSRCSAARSAPRSMACSPAAMPRGRLHRHPRGR